MRVDYTLPALEPGTMSDLAIPEEKGLTFRDQLMGAAAPASVSWEQQLRLDVRPYTATYLAPPRPPKTLDLNDPETQRSRWRGMLWRHSGNAGAASYSSDAQTSPIRTMLDMLLDMQQMEDAIASQSVALTRG